MIDVGLDAVGRSRLLRTLAWDHSIDITITLTDLEDRPVADLSDLLMDGQVDGAQEHRYRSTTAKVVLWDPTHKLQFDTRAPAKGQLFLDRMIKVVYSVYEWRTREWVHVPVFTGPVTAARREGPTMVVECAGKELLASKPVWDVVTYRKGSRITAAIRDLLDRAGEDPAFVSIPTWGDRRLPGDLVLGKREDVWSRATRLAYVAGGYLAYRGDGTVRLSRSSDNVVFTFRDESARVESHGPMVLSEPQAQFDTDDIVNYIHVTGQPKSTGKPAPVADAALPRDHPLNSHRNGRRGSQWLMPEWIEDNDVRSGADAQALADAKLQARAREYVHVTFDSLPLPMLETNDMCAVHTRRQIIPTFRVHEYSIPLSHAGVMSVGTRRRVHDLSRRRWR